MFVGEASDWPYLGNCSAAQKTRYNEMLMETMNFCKSNNYLHILMTPSQLPSRYFDGLDYEKLGFDSDVCHFDASALVPLQRYLQTAIYKLVEQFTEQSALVPV